MLVVLLAASAVLCVAQDDDYFDQRHERFDDHTHVTHIRTVLLHVKNSPLSMPVIMLNNGEQLELSFDDLDGEHRSYGYYLTHCDRNWQPTDMPRPQYIRGQQDEQILNYRYSFNTLQQYVHYSVLIPNANMHFTLSGNYVITVFSDYDQTRPVITRRFRVYENLVSLKPEVKMPMEIEKRRTHHQIGLTIEHSKYDIANPIGDLSVQIFQNYRWDNAKIDLKPIFIRKNELVYDNMGEILFEGGNEFRWVDIRSLRYQPENVRDIFYDRDSLRQHVFLINDKPNRKNYYTTQSDLNGAYQVIVREGNDPATESDYAYVHFGLDWPEPETNGVFYIFGGLSDWQMQQDLRLEYNRAEKAYVGLAYLKQGFYSYQYLFVPDDAKEGSVEPSEASFFQASQVYTFFVYHRGMGMNYDRLVGHTITSSRI